MRWFFAFLAAALTVHAITVMPHLMHPEADLTAILATYGQNNPQGALLGAILGIYLEATITVALAAICWRAYFVRPAHLPSTEPKPEPKSEPEPEPELAPRRTLTYRTDRGPS